MDEKGYSFYAAFDGEIWTSNYWHEVTVSRLSPWLKSECKVIGPFPTLTQVWLCVDEMENPEAQ